MENDYHKQAEQFLNDASITFSFTLIGSDCPPFCEDARKRIDMDKVDVFPRKTHIHGKHYRCTFERRVKVSEANGKPVYSDYDPKPRPTLVIDFWNSYADEEFNALGTKAHRQGETMAKYGRDRNAEGKMIMGRAKRPTPYSILACLTKYDPGTFENFCSEFGSDPDSRQALATFEAVQSEYERVAAFFTEAELALVQEIS